ncbi:hypothetical protein HanIR_Chr09g0404571 [Helianthus annuus]|nr:hypothetical protein HanIR_Chr09g0404571 [Helianthus annuus]
MLAPLLSSQHISLKFLDFSSYMHGFHCDHAKSFIVDTCTYCRLAPKPIPIV